MEEKKLFTVSIYTENNVGLLNRVSAVFLKRHINIESINSSKSEIENVNRFVMVVRTTQTLINKVVGQLEKQIEVIKAYAHTDDELIFEECALYKMKSDTLFDSETVKDIIKDNHAQLITVERNFFVIEKTGHRDETEKLYKELAPFGILQFVRSGRIAVSKEIMAISEILK